MRLSAIAATAAAMLALSACGAESSEEAVEASDSGEYRIDTESGENSMTIETPDGAVSMRAGSNVEIDLPGGFTLIEGATVLNNTVVEQADGKGTLVTFRTELSPETVADYYRAEAKAAGVDVQLDTAMNEGRMLGGESENGLTFSMSANPGEDGTLGQLVVGIGEDY